MVSGDKMFYATRMAMSYPAGSHDDRKLLDTPTTKGYNNFCAEVAQLVEQRTENPCVPSSILGLGTTNWHLAEDLFNIGNLKIGSKFTQSNLKKRK